MRLLLNALRWRLMDAKWAGEAALRGSGLPFAIVRPGGLTNGAPGEAQLDAGARARGSRLAARPRAARRSPPARARMSSLTRLAAAAAALWRPARGAARAHQRSTRRASR